MTSNTIANRGLLLSLLIFLFANQYSFSQSEWKDIENFESYPSGWRFDNKSSSNQRSFGWDMNPSSTGGGAYSGSPSSSMIAGMGQDPTEGDVVSQWLITKEYPVTNGDQISFWTKSLKNSNGEDRLQVRLSSTGGISIPNNPFLAGDFDILLDDINSGNAKGGYPQNWTKKTYTVTGLPAGEVVKTRFALRYYLPWFKNPGAPSSLPVGNEDPSDLQWQQTEQYLKQIGIEIAFMVLDEVTDGLFGAGLLFYQWGSNIFNFFLSLFGSQTDRTTIAIDAFEFNPVDLKLSNEANDLFTTQSTSRPYATLVKDYCVPVDIEGVNRPNQNEILGYNVQNISVINRSGGYISFSNGQITGPDASSFQFYQNSSSFGTSPYTPSRFKIKFEPTTPGTKEAIVSYNTDHPSFPTVQFKIQGFSINVPSSLNLTCINPVDLKLGAGESIRFDNDALSLLDHGNLNPFWYIDFDASSFGGCTYNQLIWNIDDGITRTYTASDLPISVPVTISITDPITNGTASCNTTVNLTENTPPNVPENYQIPSRTYDLHPDSTVLHTSELIVPTYNTTSDGLVSAELSFDGEIGGHGSYLLWWRFVDNSRNFTKSYGQTIQVNDVTPPTASCQNITIGYSSGSANNPSKAIATAKQVNLNSSDVASTDLSYKFWIGSGNVPAVGTPNDPNLVDSLFWSCSEEGTTQAVTFVVKDNITQQQSVCQANVNILPLDFDQCVDHLASLNYLTQTATITLDDVYQGPGGCLQQTVTLSKTTFDCNDLGINFVDITVSRANDLEALIPLNVRLKLK